MAEKAKYQFNGQTYTIKGRLCHDIVKYYAEQNLNATLATLQKAFNTATHMIVATPEMALTVINSNGKAGGDYYMKESDQISTKKGKVVVWSYWPESYFKPFMEQVKALGLDVTLQEGEENIENKESNSSGMKKLNLFIGGNDVYYFYVKDYGSGDDLEELKAKEDDFRSEISEFFDSLNDCVIKYNVVTMDDDLKVSVKDKGGKIVFEDRIDECNPFEGDFENWLFSDDVDQEVINALKGYVEEKKQDGSFDGDEFSSDMLEYFGPRFAVERVCELNGYGGKKWFVLKWGKLEPMADDDETERAEYEAPFGHSYGVGYCGEIEIPENEDFDIEKLQFLVDDYLGLLPDDDCIDSVLPYVKYGNRVFKLHLKNSYWRSEKYGLVRLNPTYGSLSFKDYEEFLDE